MVVNWELKNPLLVTVIKQNLITAIGQHANLAEQHTQHDARLIAYIFGGQDASVNQLRLLSYPRDRNPDQLLKAINEKPLQAADVQRIGAVPQVDLALCVTHIASLRTLTLVQVADLEQAALGMPDQASDDSGLGPTRSYERTAVPVGRGARADDALRF
jgi:hypothetical protein